MTAETSVEVMAATSGKTVAATVHDLLETAKAANRLEHAVIGILDSHAKVVAARGNRAAKRPRHGVKLCR